MVNYWAQLAQQHAALMAQQAGMAPNSLMAMPQPAASLPMTTPSAHGADLAKVGAKGVGVLYNLVACGRAPCAACGLICPKTL